jgi:hypothetical protein
MRKALIILSCLAALVTVAVSIFAWYEIRLNPDQNLWPVPGGYPIEISVLATLAVVAAILDVPNWPVIMWTTTGVLLAFCFWGAMSIGLLYLPSFTLFFIPSCLAAMRQKGKILLDLGAGLAGVIGQSALIWLMILVVSNVQL